MRPEVAGAVNLLRTLIEVELLAAAVVLLPVITAGILAGIIMMCREALSEEKNETNRGKDDTPAEGD